MTQLCLILACGLAWLRMTVLAAQLMRGGTDGHVLYSPPEQLDIDACQDLTNATCDGHWWSVVLSESFKGVYKNTWGNDTRMDVTFQGSGVAVIGIADVNGARAFVSVDGGAPAHADFSSAAGRLLNQTMFSVSGLDPGVPHTLTLWYDNESYGGAGAERRFVNIDAILFSYPDDANSPFPEELASSTSQSASEKSSSLPSTSTSTTQSSSAVPVTPEALATHAKLLLSVAVLGSVCAVVLAVLSTVLLLLRCRRCILRRARPPTPYAGVSGKDLQSTCRDEKLRALKAEPPLPAGDTNLGTARDDTVIELALMRAANEIGMPTRALLHRLQSMPRVRSRSGPSTAPPQYSSEIYEVQRQN